MAREAFRDAFAAEWVDARQDASENRYAMIGTVENRLLFCCLRDLHPMSVVDSELRVHGIEGQRVIDASVMPAVTSTKPTRRRS